MTLVFAIDIGNTRVKWGWWSPAQGGGQWLRTGACSHAEVVTVFAPAVREDAAARIILCSVADLQLTTQVMAETSRAQRGVPIERFDSRASAGCMRNAYDDPEALGPDRLAAALGARQHVPEGAFVLASFGTATTIDTVSPGNEFLGGVILPGLAVMATSLASSTAQLPEIEARDVIAIDMPANTHQAITEGIMRAQQGAVELTLAHARARFGDVSLLLAGGGAQVMQGRMPALRVLEHPVLDGLIASL
jgi:type III pantothenate kinase